MSRRIFTVLAIAGLVIFALSSCSLFGPRTFSYEISGMCIEVSTSNSDLIDALELSGYEEAPCSIAAAVGTCTLADYTGFEEYDATWSVQYDESTYGAGTAEAACDLLSGTWTAQ